MHFSRAVSPKKLSPTRSLLKGDIGTSCAALSHGTLGKRMHFLPKLFLSPLASLSSPHPCFSVTVNRICTPACLRMLDEGLRAALGGLMVGKGCFLSVRNFARYLLGFIETFSSLKYDPGALSP